MQYCLTTKHAFIFYLCCKHRLCDNFRVRLEDVHCGINEVIFSEVQQFNKKRVSKEKCQRKSESSILTGGKLQCLVRLQVISVPKSFYLKRHYSSKHEKTHGKFHGNSREEF